MDDEGRYVAVVAGASTAMGVVGLVLLTVLGGFGVLVGIVLLVLGIAGLLHAIGVRTGLVDIPGEERAPRERER